MKPPNTYLCALATSLLALACIQSVKGEEENCCGDTRYDPASEECCGGTTPVPKGRCCNGEELEEGFECCKEVNPEVPYIVEDQCCTNEGAKWKVTVYSDWERFSSLCPNRASRESYTPASNGCSNPFNGALSQHYNEVFESCCDAHDIGYGTCNSDKESEDADFYNCMMDTCHAAYANGEVPSVLDCQAIGLAYTLAVAYLGSFYWENAQLIACQCCE